MNPFNVCSMCGKSFKRKEHLNVHIKSVHDKIKFKCIMRSKSMCESSIVRHLRKTCKKMVRHQRSVEGNVLTKHCIFLKDWSHPSAICMLVKRAVVHLIARKIWKCMRVGTATVKFLANSAEYACTRVHWKGMWIIHALFKWLKTTKVLKKTKALKTIMLDWCKIMKSRLQTGTVSNIILMILSCSQMWIQCFVLEKKLSKCNDKLNSFK